MSINFNINAFLTINKEVQKDLIRKADNLNELTLLFTCLLNQEDQSGVRQLETKVLHRIQELNGSLDPTQILTIQTLILEKLSPPTDKKGIKLNDEAIKFLLTSHIDGHNVIRVMQFAFANRSNQLLKRCIYHFNIYDTNNVCFTEQGKVKISLKLGLPSPEEAYYLDPQTNYSIIRFSEVLPSLIQAIGQSNISIHFTIDNFFDKIDLLPSMETYGPYIHFLEICSKCLLNSHELEAVLTHCPHLQNLSLLNATQMNESGISQALSHTPNLTELNLSNCKDIHDMTVLSNLTNLRTLSLSLCSAFQSLNSLDLFPQLTELHLSFLPKLDLTQTPKKNHVQKLKVIVGKFSLNGIENFSHLENLQIIRSNRSSLNFISTFKNLRSLKLQEFYNLQSLEGLGELNHLEHIELMNCENFQSLSGIERVTNLASLNLRDLEKIQSFEGLGELSQLATIIIDCCRNLQTLKGIEKAINLRFLSIERCEISDEDRIKTLITFLEKNLPQGIDLFPHLECEDLDILDKLLNDSQVSEKAIYHALQADSKHLTKNLEILYIYLLKYAFKKNKPRFEKTIQDMEIHLKNVDTLNRLQAKHKKLCRTNQQEDVDIPALKEQKEALVKASKKLQMQIKEQQDRVAQKNQKRDLGKLIGQIKKLEKEITQLESLPSQNQNDEIRKLEEKIHSLSQTVSQEEQSIQAAASQLINDIVPGLPQGFVNTIRSPSENFEVLKVLYSGLKEINEIRVPALKYTLFKHFMKMYSVTGGEGYKIPTLKIKESRYPLTLTTTIKELEDVGVEATGFHHYLSQHAERFNDVKYINPLIKYLNRFCMTTFPISHADLFRKILYEGGPSIAARSIDDIPIVEPKQLLDNLITLFSIVDLGYTNQLQLNTYLKGKSEQAFKEVLGIENIPNIAMKYAETFGAFRMPESIMILTSKYQSLRDPELMHCFKDFFTAVLNDTFKQERYDSDKDPHLEKLSTRMDLKTWIEPVVSFKLSPSAPVASSSNNQGETFSLDMHEWLKDKIDQGHIEKGTFPELRKFLTAKDRAAEIEKYQGQKSNELLSIQVALMQLTQCMDKRSTISQLKVILKLLEKTSMKGQQLYSDCEQLIKLLNQKRHSEQELSVIETDSPEDLMLCGTEVLGSCQDVNGEPVLNKGLIGYLMNGKVKMLAVVDEKGKIKSRSIMKLVLDKNDNPVLLLEPMYPSTISQRENEAIMAMALKKAQQMGDIPVVTVAGFNGKRYTSPLHILPCRAPYEYSDILLGVQDSRYRVDISPELNLEQVNAKSFFDSCTIL